MLWPIILISLGIEILVYSKKNAKIKYDFFGMIMICMVLGCTFIMSTASYVLNDLLFERGINDIFLDRIEENIKSNL